MKALAVTILLLGSLVLAGPAAAVSAAEEWFDDEGRATLHSYAPSVFPDLTQAELSDLEIGEPVPSVDLDDSTSDPRIGDGEPDRFIAPIELRDEAVGVISHQVEAVDGEDEAAVRADAVLGEHIRAMKPGDRLITDPDISAHYVIRDGEVIPVSERALDQLAGSTSVESFLEMRRSLKSDTETHHDAAPPSDRGPVMVASTVVVVFLVAIALILWLRRSPHAPLPPEIILRRTRQVRMYRRGGNRVNADD